MECILGFQNYKFSWWPQPNYRKVVLRYAIRGQKARDSDLHMFIDNVSDYTYGLLLRRGVIVNLIAASYYLFATPGALLRAPV
jgi:hypothetical protein